MAGHMQVPHLSQKLLSLKFYCLTITNLSFSLFVLVKFKLICMFMALFFHSGGAPSAPPLPSPSSGTLVLTGRYVKMAEVEPQVPQFY